MKKCFQLFAFLLLSLCSLAALAVPTVQEVEGEIAAGQYDKAKVLIKEVLKANPDSIVAHKYMIQIMDLEYAQTLKPSVEYKLYENNIEAIKVKIAKDKQDVVNKEYNERIKIVVKILFILMFIVPVALLVWFILIPRIKVMQENKRVEIEKIDWQNKAWADVLDIGIMINNMYSMNETKTFMPHVLGLLKSLAEDNDDVMGCLERNDYNRKLVDRHVSDAFSFFKSHGVEV